MAFEVYFSISRTAVEIIAIAAMTAAIAYVVDDLIEKDEARNRPVD